MENLKIKNARWLRAKRNKGNYLDKLSHFINNKSQMSRLINDVRLLVSETELVLNSPYWFVFVFSLIHIWILMKGFLDPEFWDRMSQLSEHCYWILCHSSGSRAIPQLLHKKLTDPWDMLVSKLPWLITISGELSGSLTGADISTFSP